MKIEYLSDTDSDFQCLEEYLESGELGVLFDEEFHKLQQNIDLLLPLLNVMSNETPEHLTPLSRVEEISKMEIALPTKFESPISHLILKDLIIKIKTAAKACGCDIGKFPHYSNIPTGLVNAQALKLSCSKREFILFDSQLFTYCNLFAKSLSLCLPKIRSEQKTVSFSFEYDAVFSHLESNQNGIQKLLELLHSFTILSRPGKAKQYFVEKDYDPLSSLIRGGMELFIVAHEFGHVYGGHLNTILPSLSFETLNKKDISEAHQEEHEADLVGLLLTIQAQKDTGYDYALSLFGIDLFFSSLMLAEKYIFFLEHGEDDGYVCGSSKSHPSLYDRQSYLREFIQTYGQILFGRDDLLSFLIKGDKIIDLVWDKCKFTKKRGVRILNQK